MKLHTATTIAGLALLTIAVQPVVATAGNDKAAEKNIATDSMTMKKAPLMQKQAEGTSGAKGVSGAAGEKGSAGIISAETRDWVAIDSNKDHYIQPEEMEKYLTDSWAAQKKAAQKAK
jgi:hypothetical protein